MVLNNEELQTILEARSEAENAALDIAKDVRMDDVADLQIILSKLKEIGDVLSNNILNN